MNKQRRKAIDDLAARFDALDFGTLKDELESIKEDLEALKTEEEEYLENMSENLKGGDKGQAAEAAIEKMDELMTALDEGTEKLEYFCGTDLSEAKGE